jgi:hypothetical protein
MTDSFPRWPPDWIDEHDLAAEEVLAATDDVSLMSALRKDDRVLMSVSWPGGRRYMLIDPLGNNPPQALRIGERAEDAEVSRIVEALWSQALTIAKQLMDGELPAIPPPEEDPPKRRRWGRG